jgi:enterochelin esterase-like enzyme
LRRLTPLYRSNRGHLEIVEIESKVFSNTRKIRVWLPLADAEVRSHGDRYPVLYMNDGQDLFDAEESVFFSGDWMIDEILHSLIKDGKIRPTIVVGIDNAGRRGRAREYLPYPDSYLTPPEPDPMGSLYASFLKLDVIPLVESRYPVQSEKAGRTLGGSSYGALIALYVAVTEPELFGQLLLERPSLYVDNGHVLKDVAEIGLNVDRVYLGAGTNEVGGKSCGDHGGYIEVVKGILDLANILVNKGMPADQIRVNIEPCAIHSPAAWSRRIPAAASFLFYD